MKLSIVATLYKSEAYVYEFCERVNKVTSQITDDYEVILVNDGSPDDSLGCALNIQEKNSHVVIVDLSRNYGHHKAMMTGLMHATGDYVFLIDSDLEERPEWLDTFFDEMEKCVCDVVYGVQEKRKGNIFEKITGIIFWKIINMLSGMSLPENITTARLMTRRYVNALLQHEEREVFIAGLWHITGYEQRPVNVKKESRSKSTYTLRKKISLLVNSITSFSNAPLVLIFYTGLFISVFSGAYNLYLAVNWLFWSKPPDGWTSVMASIWLLGGLVIFFIGVIGIYLSKVFSETKRRPYTIVRQVYEKKL